MATLSSTLKASKEAIYALLTDYPSYPDWAVDVAEAAVLDQENDIVVVEFNSPELLAEKYVLELVHSAADSILYQQVDQFEGYGLRGSWQLADASEGTLLTCEMHLKLDFWASFHARRKVELILRRRVEALGRKLTDSPTTQWFAFPP